MLNGPSDRPNSLIAARLTQPERGSSSSAQAIAMGSVGRKKAIQNRNSILRRQRRLVRIKSQASRQPITTEIGTRMADRIKVLAIASQIDGLEKAAIHPSKPHVVGWPGSEVRNELTTMIATGASATMLSRTTGRLRNTPRSGGEKAMASSRRVSP